ncbi:MAG: dihydroorotate dehydrogenase, partial [Phycisphaerae bacterium]|nr:dihydroorotate dehydrogenase [Phycisphaerae bacterium]
RTIDEYREVAQRLDEVEEISGLEVNISCPNVQEGGMSFGTDAREVSRLVSAVRQVVKRCTLVVKLTPNVTDILEPARAAVEAGAQCLSLVNTFTSLAIDIEQHKPVLANVTGGLSGPAIKPIALYMVHRVYTELCRDAGIPIIGMGGVQFGTDAIEFLLAGATAVGVGTALFVEPNTPKILAEELRGYLAERDMTAPVAIIGKLQVPEKGSSEL